MCLKCDLTKVLGVDKQAISDKSADFARYMLESRMFGKADINDINKYMDDNFSTEELKVLALSFIMVKTQETLQEMSSEGNPIALGVMMGKIFKDQDSKSN